MQRKKDISEQAKQVLTLMAFFASRGEKVTTQLIADVRGTRVGPANRMLQKLKRRGHVVLELDPVGNKAARCWSLRERS